MTERPRGPGGRSVQGTRNGIARRVVHALVGQLGQPGQLLERGHPQLKPRGPQHESEQGPDVGQHTPSVPTLSRDLGLRPDQPYSRTCSFHSL